MSSHAEREAKDNLWIKSEQNSRFRHIFPKLHIVYMVGGYPQGPPPPPPPNETLHTLYQHVYAGWSGLSQTTIFVGRYL